MMFWYNWFMKKAEYIAKYGEEKYAAFLAKQKAKRTSPEGRAQRAAYMKTWYAKQKGGEVRPVQKRGLTGVNDGSYWEKWGQLPDVKAKNRDKARAAFQALSQDERRELGLRRRAARKAKKAADPQFFADARAKERERILTWRAKNPERQREINAKWRAAHPFEQYVAKIVRRAGGPVSKAFVRFLKAQPCIDCGTTERIEVGHLIPVVRGGTNHPCNLVAQCRTCNARQGANIHPRAMMAHYPEAARYAVAA
jgi:5-methylcytosine-specific restriction endonuclease McrA